MTRARPTPPRKGERGSEGSAPALRARVSKCDEANFGTSPVPPPGPADKDGGPPTAAPPSREEMAAEAWQLYHRATRAEDFQTATRALRTYGELTGHLGTVNQRRRTNDLAERLRLATAALHQIPGVK